MRIYFKLFVALAIISFCLAACIKPTPARPYETITGRVTDTNGTPLERIIIATYSDEQLQNWEGEGYSDSSGIYHISHVSLYYEGHCEQTREIYITATDPSGTYVSQTQHAKMIYSSTTYESDLKDINFVMQKSN